MVRNYIRKRNSSTNNEDELLNAIEKIKVGEWTYKEAFENTKIPKGTLAARISRGSSGQIGRPTALTYEEEIYLVKLIETMQDWGELCSYQDVMKYSTEYVKLMNLTSRFKSGAPTKEWYYTFVKRWSQKLTLMKSVRLEKSRAGLTQEIVDGWFTKLYSVLKKLNLLDKPANIFNGDESGFGDDPGKKVVLVKRGTKYANQVHGGTGKSHTTVLLTISADGTCLPPYIIYKSLRLYDQWCPKNVIPGAVFNGTESGWIDEDCFYDYLLKLFIPKTQHIPRPLLLILDNHSTHLSIKTAKLAIQHHIHILCFPAHGTHILQPLDVYTFKYVKTQWRSLLWEFNQSSRNKTLEKSDFVRLFAKLYDYALLPAHCSPSFAKAGIYPYDPRIIRKEKLIKNGTNASTTTTNTGSLVRSVSVELNDPASTEYLTTTSRTTTKRNKLVKCPSAPNLNLDTFHANFDHGRSANFDTSNLPQQVTATCNNAQLVNNSSNHSTQALAQASMESTNLCQSSISFANLTESPSNASTAESTNCLSLSNSVEKGTFDFCFFFL
ncbi:unnamed protein product [Rotaria magnacalcarata]|uniref:DDE-1 domain-containing protein n=1 Tax=Rotaria magnacalcarata TaxID=392030 RepID=A0A816X7J8_9BILA|nr:unnamed protein product [Rotaria magnacalcarata]